MKKPENPRAKAQTSRTQNPAMRVPPRKGADESDTKSSRAQNLLYLLAISAIFISMSRTQNPAVRVPPRKGADESNEKSSRARAPAQRCRAKPSRAQTPAQRRSAGSFRRNLDRGVPPRKGTERGTTIFDDFSYVLVIFHAFPFYINTLGY